MSGWGNRPLRPPWAKGGGYAGRKAATRESDLIEVYRRMKQEQAKLLPVLKPGTKQKDNEEYPTTDPQPGSEQESADVNKPTVWELLKKIAQKKSEE